MASVNNRSASLLLSTMPWKDGLTPDMMVVKSSEETLVMLVCRFKGQLEMMS